MAVSSYYSLTPEQKKARIAQVSTPQAQTAQYNSAISKPVTTPTTGVSATANPTGYNPPGSQQSAQAYINKEGNPYGGLSGYTANQQNRFNDASAQGDTELLGKLNADASRVGYSFKPYQPVQQTAQVQQGYTPQNSAYTVGTDADRKNEANNQFAASLEEKRRISEQQKTGIQTSFNRLNTRIGQDRTLQDFNTDNTASPFSGRTQYAKGIQNMERERADFDLNSDNLTRQADIDNLLAGYESKTLEEKQRIIAELTRADRTFGLEQGQLTGDYNGGRTLAAQGQDYAQGADQRDFAYNSGQDQKKFDYQVGRDQVGDERYNNEFQYQQTRDQRNDYESDRLFDYGSYRDNVGDQKWQTEFQQAVKNQATQMGYNYASLNQRERQMMAEQTAKADDKAYSRMQDQFTMGMQAFESTGKMPDYMENFGINTKGFNDDTTKEAVSIAYGALSSGQMTPEAMLKQVDFELSQGIIDKKTADGIKETVYYVNPESSPASVAEQKAKQEKRQNLIKSTYDFATKIPSVNITNKVFEWGKGLFD